MNPAVAELLEGVDEMVAEGEVLECLDYELGRIAVRKILADHPLVMHKIKDAAEAGTWSVSFESSLPEPLMEALRFCGLSVDPHCVSWYSGERK